MDVGFFERVCFGIDFLSVVAFIFIIKHRFIELLVIFILVNFFAFGISRHREVGF